MHSHKSGNYLLNYYTFLFLYFFIFHRNSRNSFVISEANTLRYHLLTIKEHIVRRKYLSIYWSSLIYLFECRLRRKLERYIFIICYCATILYSRWLYSALHGTRKMYILSCFPQSLKISLKLNTLLLILAFIHRRTLQLALRSHTAHAISISASSASLRTVNGIERKSIRFSKGLGSATQVLTKC